MKIDIQNVPHKYSVIYADPPWAYRRVGRGSAENHYPVMSTDDICRIPVKEIKTDDALLFMWATFPTIQDAIKVMDAWGFAYKTAAFVWIKTNIKSETLFWGLGSYTRSNAEVCLLGISKKTKAHNQIKVHNVHQVVLSPIQIHSRKPKEVRQRIKTLTGGEGTYIELFARESIFGWDCWGNEAPI